MFMKRVAIIGSGNWGTVAAICMSQNIIKMSEFDPIIKMWVHEEYYNGRYLSEIINNDRVNIKYLPGHTLPSNIEAVVDIKSVVKEATHIAFVVPHQFIEKIANDIATVIRKDAIGISLIKGIIEQDDELIFISEMLEKKLGCRMSVLSGANIASEIASENFSETTIGSLDINGANEWKQLIETNYFKVNVINTCYPLELCGALKNCVAVAIGFVDGLGQGYNTKAAIMRIGMNEMIEFCKLYTTIDDNNIFFESFGIGDLIATCLGGRNHLVCKAYIESTKSIDELESELLNGQKLQGPNTLLHVGNLIKANKLENKFPLMMSTYAILYEKAPKESFITLLMEKLTK